MTFRLDRALATAGGAGPAGAPRRASLVLDLASGTGDLCVDLQDVGFRPISIDLSAGMLAPTQ